MNIFVTSDNHFFHDKPFIVNKRGFSTAEEMTEKIIDNWNTKIKKDDLVYHIGDIAFCNTNSKFKELMDRLNGKIIFILGSHDKIVRQYKQRFIMIEKKHNTEVNKQSVTFIHECPKVWHKSHYNSWALCGHSHGELNEYMENEGKLLDCGVDSYNKIFGGFHPFSWDEIVDIMKTRPDNFNIIR